MDFSEETSEIYRTSSSSSVLIPSIGADFGRNRGILPEPRHMGVGLGPIPKDMIDSDDPLWTTSPSRGSRKAM